MATIRYNTGQQDPRRVVLDEKDSVRLNRAEYEATRGLLGAVSYLASAKDNLYNGKAMELIPHGRDRMRMVVGGVRSLAEDLMGVIPIKQCKQLYNSTHDMEMRFVPKTTPEGSTILMEKALAKELLDLARTGCRDCTKDGISCRKCGLYKIMEATTPLADYGNDMICPYALAEWEDKI